MTESRFDVCLEMSWVEGWITKGQQETFGGDGSVHQLDCGDDFMDVYSYENS